MTAGASRPQQPGDSPGFLLWRVTLRWQRHISTALRPLGLTHVQFVLLATLGWLEQQRRAGGLPSQREVADTANVDPMMASQVLRALEQRGLVSRQVAGDDARARLVGLTVPGRELAVRALEAVEAVDADFFSVADGSLLPTLRALDAGDRRSLREGPPGQIGEPVSR